MYKALLGPRAAVYGDHVELTRIANASSDNEQDVGRDLLPLWVRAAYWAPNSHGRTMAPNSRMSISRQTKEAHWKEWISLYNEKMLSKGNFLNLYVYGFDVPEGYTIEKDGQMYYAFYAPTQSDPAQKKGSASAHWSGDVELRGLAAKTYRITDYVHHKEFGTIARTNRQAEGGLHG